MFITLSLRSSALIFTPANVFVDLAMAGTTYCIYMLDDFEEDPAREWVFYVGLATGVCTFALSLVFWALYNVFRSHNYMLLLCLANAVVRTVCKELKFYAYTDYIIDICLGFIIKRIDGR